MARAVIGGLLTSTALTLLVVPVMYTVLDDFGAWFKRRLGFNKADSTAGTGTITGTATTVKHD
jgi:HAE1 family hydrophobic/amphiphilic exporter-1